MSSVPVVPPTRAELEHEIAELDADSLTVGSEGHRLHVLDYGGPSAVPALLLPGITSPAIAWGFMAARVTGVVRPYVMDLRGRGLSDCPRRGYALADYAGDVRRVVDELSLERPVLVGHSLGARIAAAVAVEDPELARALVLIEPPLSGPGRPYPTSLTSFVDQLREAVGGCTAEDVRRHHPRWPLAELELRARWLSSCAEHAVVETHRGFERDQFMPLWRDLRTPLYLLYGAESPVLTAADAKALAVANRSAECIAVPNAGHMVPWESPDTFAAILGGVLQIAVGADQPVNAIPTQRTI